MRAIVLRICPRNRAFLELLTPHPGPLPIEGRGRGILVLSSIPRTSEQTRSPLGHAGVCSFPASSPASWFVLAHVSQQGTQAGVLSDWWTTGHCWHIEHHSSDDWRSFHCAAWHSRFACQRRPPGLLSRLVQCLHPGAVCPGFVSDRRGGAPPHAVAATWPPGAARPVRPSVSEARPDATTPSKRLATRGGPSIVTLSNQRRRPSGSDAGLPIRRQRYDHEKRIRSDGDRGPGHPGRAGDFSRRRVTGQPGGRAGEPASRFSAPTRRAQPFPDPDRQPTHGR